MTQTQRIRTETEKALALLSTATDLINSGRLVSIASLNGMIDTICRLAREEEYADCVCLKPLMLRLAEQIEAFRLAMERQYGFLSQTDHNG
ncbi:MAG: hypothetical protein ACI4TE_09700 [Alphaproteobacteria bacterium]